MKSDKENTGLASTFDSGSKTFDALNPQSNSRAILDDALAFQVYSKCVHKVKGCRHCNIVPLLDKNNRLVSYFVDHRRKDERLIECTIGMKGINPYMHKRIKKILSSIPEMGFSQFTDAEPSINLGNTTPVQEIKIDPAMSRMHSEDSILSEPDSIEHIQSTLGSQLEQVQLQMKNSFSTPLVKRASRCIEQLVLLVVGLQYDTSLEAIVLRCVQFLSAITEGGIVLTLKDALMKYAGAAEVPSMLKGKTVKEIYETEQSSPAQPEMLSADSMKIWETMKQGIFTKHLSYILGTVFAFSACKIKGVKFNHPIYEKIAEHASAEEIDGMDLIDHAIKLYNWTATVGMACLEARSFAPLTVNSTTLATCHEKYYFWHKKFLDFKRDGNSTMEERQLMFVEIELVQKKLESFVKCQREKFMTLQASSLYREVLVLYNDIKDFVQKVDRVKVAKGYHLVGTPKSGKSTIAPMIQEQICLARGCEYREQDNAQINLLAPYQDELNNATQTITINETIPIKEHLAKSVEVAYNTALALVDPVPFHPNRSNLEDKAKITCTHVGVVSTGNTVQPFINVARTPGAWERRYTIIEMSVKEQYSDEFGRIDSSKCDGSDDYHWFDVYEIVYTDKQRRIVYFELNGRKSLKLDTSELFELIRKQCIDHFAEQDKIDKNHTLGKKPGCLVCNRLGSMCKCPDKDAFTLAGKRVTNTESSVQTVPNKDDICPAASIAVGQWRTVCDFRFGECIRCARPDPDLENDCESASSPIPEMGVVSAAISTAGSLVWSSFLPWLNPFIKAKWLWSIDNNVMRVFHEEIVEELSYWPDVMGCKFLQLVPKSWEQRPDGSLTWYGQKKDTFLRMIAAEKQIFLPLSYLLRRALFWGLLTFIITICFGGTMEYFGLNPREYDQVILKERIYQEWGWYYFFPQYSQFVMDRREFYAGLGIFTERYLDWNDFYMNIYFFEKLLGKLCIPWYFTFSKWIPVLETRLYSWWLMPCIVSASVSVFLFLFMWYRRWLGFESRYRDLQARSMSDPNLQKNLYDKIRRHKSEYNSFVPTAVGLIGAVVTGLVIWNTMRGSPEVEITRSEKTRSWSDWFNFTREVPEPQELKNSSSVEIQNIVSRCLTKVEATVDGKKRYIHALYVRPGILMIPRHFFKKDPYKEEIMEELDLYLNTKGVKHKCRAYHNSMARIAFKDMVLLKVTKAPKLPKAIDYLLPKKSGKDSFKSVLVFLNDNGSVCKEELNATYNDEIESAGYSCGRGLSYISKYTNTGFCGSVLISDRRDGAILGFHISGKPYGISSRRGYAQEILYQDYEAALNKLRALPDFTNTPEMKSLCTTRFGIDLVPGEGPHPKTEMFEDGAMEDFSCIEVIGHDLNLPRYRSNVRRGLLSPAIEEHFGQPCRWRAPHLKEPWRHHNTKLKTISEGAWEVPPESLRWAVDDYKAQNLPHLLEHIKSNPHLCRVLTLDEAINGVPDSLYMGPLKMDTSPGIVQGTKSNSVIFEKMAPYPDGRNRYKFSKIGQDYYDRMMAVIDNGEMFGVWLKSCLKDEVVPEDKHKVRVFFILECVFGIACRQRFLPVAEFMSRYPLISECMVGINCAGPEWELMTQHVNELAVDGMLTDLDFKEYDLRRSCDVTCASLNYMRWVTQQMLFSDKELMRMETMGEELRNPIINWNGTIVRVYLWSSGNNMTVYGNSIENSLHMRISFHWNGIRLLGNDFYSLGTFSENEHIATYGDDCQSGSRPEVRELTDFFAKKQYFDSIGMRITDARKSDDPQPVVDSGEVDFLKRKSVYHDALFVRVGALDKESIWKMGHMSSGKGEPEDLAIAAMQSMLMESFLHGKEFYEYMREGLTKCAIQNDVWNDVLERTYEDKVVLWHEKYSI